ncbi:MAG: CDP-alcohol phosphatidyltransferase family protein [Treponema sp.]|nr:CDP-alcohol phosphatidyltransferase family protein [Treponema sp.]
MSTSNKFTTVRVIAAPIVFLLYFIPIWTGHFAATSMCILLPFLVFAEITDGLDGHFARKHNEVSDFGKVYDPFADVILHLSSFCCLMFSMKRAEIPMGGYMPAFIFVLIFYRELTMTFLRMVAVMQGTAIAARKGGKLKTVMYIISAFYGFMLETLVRCGVTVQYNTMRTMWGVGIGLFVVCLILCYVSFVDYLIAFKPVFKSINNKK